MFYNVNSLPPSDAIWWHTNCSTPFQFWSRCLIAPGHNLNQCWLNILLIHIRTNLMNTYKLRIFKVTRESWILTTSLMVPPGALGWITFNMLIIKSIDASRPSNIRSCIWTDPLLLSSISRHSTPSHTKISEDLSYGIGHWYAITPTQNRIWLLIHVINSTAVEARLLISDYIPRKCNRCN